MSQEQKNEATSTQGPKKRGRPRKNPEPLVALPMSATPKKRGRPRKNPEPLVGFTSKFSLTEEQVKEAREHFEVLSELSKVEQELLTLADMINPLLLRREELMKRLNVTKEAYRMVNKATKTM